MRQSIFCKKEKFEAFAQPETSAAIKWQSHFME
jgi:hypothetical protein